jgi:hypothetical protein
VTTDAGRPLPDDERQDIWRLPDILEIRTEFRQFDPPRRLTLDGRDTYLEEAIEVEVLLSEPLPIRALGPVLWVGDQPLTIAETDGSTLYRFLAPEPDALTPGATIAFGWNSPASPRLETHYRYEGPGEATGPREPVGTPG